MREAIPAIPFDSTREVFRPAGGLARRLWRSAGRALARVNGTAVAASVHASDMDQLRRAMRD